MPRAFTIIELMVCIAILMILIGLALPPMARARETARATQSAVNLRMIGQAITAYSDGNAGRFPIGAAGRLYPVSLAGSISMSFGDHFDFGRNLPLLLRDVAPWEEFYTVWFSPGVRRPAPSQAAANLFSCRYSHSFLARPELWRPGAVGNDLLLTAVRDSDLTFPAGKVVAWDGKMAYLLRPELLGVGDMLANPTPMLFGDGHVDTQRPADATVPTRNVMNPNLTEGIQPLHNTPLGVRGRDF